MLRRFDAAFADHAYTWFHDRAAELTRQLTEDGVPPDSITFSPVADCRYVGQGFELPVVLPGITREDIATIPEAFHALHQERYGHANPEEEVEVVTLRLGGIGGEVLSAAVSDALTSATPPAQALLGTPEVILPGETAQRVHVWDRALLAAGNVIDGPAIIHQMDATTLVLSGQRATVTALGDIRIEEAA